MVKQPSRNFRYSISSMAIACGSIVVVIAAAVFAIWYVVLLFRLKRIFREQAVLAMQTWKVAAI